MIIPLTINYHCCAVVYFEVGINSTMCADRFGLSSIEARSVCVLPGQPCWRGLVISGQCGHVLRDPAMFAGFGHVGAVRLGNSSRRNGQVMYVPPTPPVGPVRYGASSRRIARVMSHMSIDMASVQVRSCPSFWLRVRAVVR